MTGATGEPLRWVLAGGGTGGHVMPALALAERLREAQEPVLFIGARRGLETRLVPEAGFELVALDARPLVGQSLSARLRNLLALGRATLAARRAIRAFRADLVISVGGYAAVPASLAARLAGVPLALLEANAVPGLANRAVARFAARIFVGFEPAAARLGRRSTTRWSRCCRGSIRSSSRSSTRPARPTASASPAPTSRRASRPRWSPSSATWRRATAGRTWWCAGPGR